VYVEGALRNGNSGDLQCILVIDTAAASVSAVYWPQVDICITASSSGTLLVSARTLKSVIAHHVCAGQACAHALTSSFLCM